jgi:hypothetical protein
VAFIVSALLQLFSITATAGDIKSIHACTKESLAAYEALASELHLDGEEAALQLGPIKQNPLNPILTIADDSTVAKLTDGEYFDDPSCGLNDAAKTCSSGAKSGGHERVDSYLCAEYPRHGAIVSIRYLTHLTLFSVYRKVLDGWQLVQDFTFEADAVFALSGDGTFQIDETFGTLHDLWRWKGRNFAPVKQWQTVSLWHGNKYVSMRLNGSGEFEGAPRLTARSALLSRHLRGPTSLSG